MSKEEQIIHLQKQNTWLRQVIHEYENETGLFASECITTRSNEPSCKAAPEDIVVLVHLDTDPTVEAVNGSPCNCWSVKRNGKFE